MSLEGATTGGGVSETTYQPDQTLPTHYDQVETQYQPATAARIPDRQAGVPKPKNLGALREIPMFEPEKDGGIQVGDFLEAVENAAFLGNLDSEDLMKVMPMRLRGPAKGFYRTFLISKQVSPTDGGLGKLWKDFKQGLSARFRKTMDPMAHLLQLTGCKQGDTETVRSYAQRVKALAYKTWPQFTQSPDEASQRLGDTLIYQHFLKGLKPDNIERVHLKGIRDIDSAVLELTNKETFAELQRAEGRSLRVNNVDSPAEAGAAAQLRGEMEGLRETVSAYMVETAELLRAHVSAVQQLTMPPEGNLETGPFDYLDPVQPYLDSAQMVNAVGLQPRLPQYPILRAQAPAPRYPASAPVRPLGPYRPPVTCFHCRGPHFRRDCPALAPGARSQVTGFPGSAAYRRSAPIASGSGSDGADHVTARPAWAAQGGDPYHAPAPQMWGMGAPQLGAVRASRPTRLMGPPAGMVPPMWSQQGWGQNWSRAEPMAGVRPSRPAGPPAGGPAASQGPALNW